MASQITRPRETSTATDFHKWAFDTAEALRRRDFTALDWERIAEEIHSLGVSEETQLASRCSQLIYHMLKVQYQPERNSRSWSRSIREQKRRIQSLLRRQPSLKTLLADPDFWTDAYSDAIALAGPENLPDEVVDRFPEHCPFSRSILEI